MWALRLWYLQRDGGDDGDDDVFIVLFVLISFIDLLIWKYLTNTSTNNLNFILRPTIAMCLLSLTALFVKRWNRHAYGRVDDWLYLSQRIADAKHKNALHNQHINTKRTCAVGSMFVLCQLWRLAIAETTNTQHRSHGRTILLIWEINGLSKGIFKHFTHVWKWNTRQTLVACSLCVCEWTVIILLKCRTKDIAIYSLKCIVINANVCINEHLRCDSDVIVSILWHE